MNLKLIKKGQAANEFFLVFVALLLIYIVFAIVYNNQAINLFQSRDNLEAFQTSHQISAAINNVYLAGDGAAINITVIASRVNVTINSGIIESSVASTNSVNQVKLLTSRINTTNVVLNREMTILNNGGTIEIN